MLKYFRFNDPFLLVVSFAVMLLIRLPLIILDFPLTLPELNWMLIGEQLSLETTMYTELWDNTGPLAVAVYWSVHQIFGKSQLAYLVIAMFLTIIQALIFNRALIRANIYNENTYVPSLLYIVFMSISFDFWTLSPILLSLTFMLFALRNVFLLDDGSMDQEIFKTGIYMGIATLFYAPAFFLLPAIVISFALFRTSSRRYLFMIVYGFFFCFLVLCIILYYWNILDGFIEHYILSFYSIHINHTTWSEILVLVALPVVVTFYAVLRVFSERGFINYQVSCQQVMVIWLIGAALTLLFNPNFAPHQLMYFVPAFSFFFAHYLLVIRRKIMAELQFLLVAGTIILLCYQHVIELFPSIRWVTYEKLIAEKPMRFREEGKKVLVLGDNLAYYVDNSVSTPYLNWQLAQKHFDHFNRYSIMTAIYNNIMVEPPEIIVDEKGILNDLFHQMPLLANMYKNRGGSIFYYYQAPLHSSGSQN